MKMRHAAVVAVLGLAMCSASYAMDTRFGGKLAINSAKLATSDTDTDSKLGIALGGTVEMAMSDAVALETGLVYTQKGGTLDVLGLEIDTDLSYLEIPVLGKFRFADGMANASVGLAIDLLMSAEVAGVDAKDSLKSLNLELVVGAGASFEAGEGEMSAGIQYALGLTDIDDTGSDETKTRTLSFVFGYTF